jgi:hypothetical protein
MDGYLNAGFGDMLGHQWLTKIHNIGFTGIRCDITGAHREGVMTELGEFEKLSPIFLFGGGHIENYTADRFREECIWGARKITDEGYFTDIPVYFEIGNEPDIAVAHWRQDPERLHDVYWDCYQTVKSINSKIEIITGGISNLHMEALDWLDSFMSSPLPNGAIVGFHRYSNGPKPDKPHNGFQSRVHEWNRLRALAGGHNLFLTETGLSQGPHGVKRQFPLCWLDKKIYLSQLEQAEAINFEWKFWKPRGVLGMVWYQHRDGQDYKDILSNYGIYDINSKEKTSVAALRGILKEGGDDV